MQRLILLLFALGLGAGLVYLIFVRELPRTEEQASALPQQTLDMTQVAMRQMRGDKVEWIVYSDHAIYNETQHQAELRPVRFQVLQSGGKNPQPLDLQGTADAALLDQAGQKVLLRGSSRVVKDKVLRLDSDLLEYLHDQGRIKATGHVEVRENNALIQAESAEYVISTGKLVLAAPRMFE